MNLLRFFIFLFLGCYSNSQTVEYRLPRNVIPREYYVTLSLGVDWFDTNVFQGSVSIYVDVLETISEIKLHARELTIPVVQLTRLSGADTPVTIGLTNQAYISDPVTDILTITTAAPIESGYYQLDIVYSGLLSLTDMHGFYKSSYLENGRREYLATTQFEATHARRAFPSWDEPAFKAKFITSIVHPPEYNAIANTPTASNETVGSYTRTNFQPTSIMSTYLNAYVVSKFTCTAGRSLTDGPPYRVCSRPETEAARSYPVDIGPKLMDALERFTGIPYSYSPIGKMDQLAIPDFSAGAMENWGLVTYRESQLLWDQTEATNRNKQSAAAVIAHEFTHMWFGDLVTMRWWSDLFLNEGFARYFQYFATHEVETTWEMDKQFVVEQVQTVLLTDSSIASAALSSPAVTPDDISNRFDNISYNKGASILRMILHLIGFESFQAAIRNYLQSYVYTNTDYTNLWDSFTNIPIELPATFREIADGWTVQAGYPVLNVRADGNDLIISQQRFLLSGESNTVWYVPVSYTKSNDPDKFTTTTAQLWVQPSSEEQRFANVLNGAEWFILNNQQTGFYRVNYDPTLWDTIATVLQNSHTDIHVLNRAQIVDDLFNFARVGNIPYSRLFNLISFMSKEVEYYPWYPAFTGFNYIRSRIGYGPAREAFNRHIATLITNVVNSVPFTHQNSQNHIYTLKQSLVLGWACSVGLADCVDHAKHIFASYKNNTNVGVNPNLKSTVYCNALRYSDNSTDDWNFLWNKYVTTSSAHEQVAILGALGCTTDEALLERYFRFAVTESAGIRRQDTSTAISSIYSSNPNGVNATIRILKQHHQLYIEFYQSESNLRSLIYTLGGRITEEAELAELQDFIDNANVTEATKTYATNVLTSARNNLEAIRAFEADLLGFLPSQPSEESSSSSINKSWFSLIIVLFAIYCQFF